MKKNIKINLFFYIFLYFINMTKYKILALFANHTYNRIKYNISINNISLIKKFVTNFIIVDSIDEYYANQLFNDIKNDDKLSHFYIIKNDNYFDFGKWIYALNLIDKDYYDYILFINDSILLTPDIKNYFFYIDNCMDTRTNLYAYNDSTQINYHYQSYLFLIKNSIIDKFIIFFESKKSLIHDLDSLVKNIELNMCNIDSNHDVFLKIGNEYNMSKNLYWENEVLYEYLLSKNICAIIKLKKIYDIHKDYKLNIYGNSISDFDADFYGNYYDDLKNIEKDKLLEHFIQIGQYEGRRPNENPLSILPYYYREKLDNIGLLYFFDIPEKFDIYYYRKIYKDVEKLSIVNSIFHYINYGIYESRIYNKIDDKNTYINNTYLNFYKNINNKKDIILPDNFNIFSFLLLNDKLYNYGYYGIINEYINNKDKYLYYDKETLNNILINFDINIYKIIHPEVNNLDYTNIFRHYISHNLNNGKIYKVPNDFNHTNYKKIYKDIRKFDNLELEIHYILYGINEKRLYKLPDDFDCDSYKKIYNDVRDLTDEKAKEHYLFYGLNERRIYKIPDDFDCNIYKKIYKDLSNLSDSKLKEHYMSYGINNGYLYKIPYDFDAEKYKLIYEDLINLSEDKLKMHYLLHGIKEKRIYKIPDDFNDIFYKNIYSDLSELSSIELKNHYMTMGIKENRIYKIPDDFDINLYKEMYPELATMTDKEIEEYYLFKGIKENKIYKIPDDFNLIFYKKIYPDLQHLNDNEIKKHYLIHGIKENREYKISNDFNYDNYRKIYKDLENLDNNELIKHYLLYGKKENRIYKIPDDFNSEVYKNIYKDLKHLSNEESKEHYLFHGISEGRVYK